VEVHLLQRDSIRITGREDQQYAISVWLANGKMDHDGRAADAILEKVDT